MRFLRAKANAIREGSITIRMTRSLGALFTVSFAVDRRQSARGNQGSVEGEKVKIRERESQEGRRMKEYPTTTDRSHAFLSLYPRHFDR